MGCSDSIVNMTINDEINRAELVQHYSGKTVKHLVVFDTEDEKGLHES